MIAWTAQLKQASWRGVPFGVQTSTGKFGRRLAVHEYPFRDAPWAEDIGRATRKIGFQAFLIENSTVYGGGPVIAQRNAMIGAAETAGPGTLIHPTLGTLTVSLESLSISERWDAGRYFELEFSFIESGAATFPSNASSTTSAVTAAVKAVNAGAATSFQNAVTPLLPAGGRTITLAVAAATAWGAKIFALASDASLLLNLGAALAGNYGRFYNGALAGPFSGALPTILPATATIETLVPIAAADRAAVASAGATVTSLVGQIGLPGAAPTDIAAAIQALIAALLVTAANPADALRLLENLTVYTAGAASQIGEAIDALFQRAAATALAQAASTYQPSSYQDANAVRFQVTAALDTVILAAGNAGDDSTFNAVRALRAAVAQDLAARGATLQPLMTFNTGAALPALTLANRLYRDGTRADQLVAQVDPVNPLFCPPSFQALAA